MIYNSKVNLILISGPVKSGKSKWAEKIISQNKDITYIATHINDNSKEWKIRLEQHKKRRPKEWHTIETPDIIKVISDIDNSQAILIDSLGGIVSYYIHCEQNEWNIIKKNIILSLKKYKGFSVIVSEETGWSVSPHTKIGNRFRDRLGELTQEIDSISTDSWLVVHGRAINLNTNSLNINTY
ncbi:bifunctional adenosylcobinamide kinase/adenosylcobinamide-phosphate guanylyltransferase [Prochlorococcus marinus]|uniref:bifunctional adenosylcobinamide kinase/adenosylcobinamide-phosphate guanylyltransferase n=1 Tax=Prochlorococcus marinus TaxID=1219 RepID=UPI0022B3A3F3|nr:bifunctional adenosylcobinamide kinase/adenosylcobinamide-phosphate guanylyltransferase [Prochlorococcus marinus]